MLLPQLNEQNTDLAEKITNVLHLLELENDKEKNVASFGQHLTEMFNSLKMELEDMDALIKAGEADMSFQNHCRALLERETGNMMQEKARIKKDQSTLLQKKYVKEAAVFKVLQQLDEYSQQEEHHKKQLEALVELSEERDLMAIHKYAKEDDKIIKSLFLATNQKKKEVERKLKILNKEWYETLTAEMAVDKANELILQLFQETKQLTIQWEKFIKQVNEWSAQNQEYQLQLFQYKLTIQEEKSKITELTLLEKSHKSKEKKLLISLRKAADHILHLDQNVNDCIAKELTQKTENTSLYKMLSNTQLVLESLRSKIRRIEGECFTYTMKVEEIRAENHNLTEQLNAVTQKTLTKDEKVVHLEQLRTHQECTIKKLEVRIEELMGKLNSQTKFLEAKTKEETTSILQIARNKVTIAEMETMRIKIEDQIMMQESNAFKIKGEKTFVQQRLAMMQGRKDDSQKFDFLKTIAELSSAVEETKKLASFHKKETSAAEDENSFLNRQNERLMKQKGQWSEKVAELDLITDTNEKALRSLLKKKCDMVAHAKVLKTEEKNMMELLLNKTDENFSFERTKLELEKAIKVREDEIREFMNLMKKQVKLSEQERQRFVMEMNEKLDMLNKMKMQFEVKFFLVAEEDKSQAYYIIKAAQEKEELIRKINLLEAQIYMHDNNAMENTLSQYKSSNAQFKNVCINIKNRESGIQDLHETKDLAKMIEYRKRQIWELQSELEDLNCSYEGLLEKEMYEDKEAELKRSVIAKRTKEFTLQKEKCDRVTKECSRLIKGTEKQAGGTKLKDLRNFTQTAADRLIEAVKHNPKLYQYVKNNS